MKKSQIVSLIVIGILLISSISIFSSYRSTYDKNVELKNKFEAQKGVIEVNYDNMWKILKDQFKLTEKESDKVKDIYIGIMEGRYSKDDGSLMKLIVENNPKFDQRNYQKLMDNIEALRKEFESEQKKILAIKEQHDNLRQKFWSRIWLGDEPELEYTKISSSYSKEVMKSGDDNSDMFSK